MLYSVEDLEPNVKIRLHSNRGFRQKTAVIFQSKSMGLSSLKIKWAEGFKSKALDEVARSHWKARCCSH